MATFTIYTKSGISFNVKAQTMNQAMKKAESLKYKGVYVCTNYTIYSEFGKLFDNSLPFLTFTRKRGYSSNYSYCLGLTDN